MSDNGLKGALGVKDKDAEAFMKKLRSVHATAMAAAKELEAASNAVGMSDDKMDEIGDKVLNEEGYVQKMKPAVKAAMLKYYAAYDRLRPKMPNWNILEQESLKALGGGKGSSEDIAEFRAKSKEASRAANAGYMPYVGNTRIRSELKK